LVDNTYIVSVHEKLFLKNQTFCFSIKTEHTKSVNLGWEVKVTILHAAVCVSSRKASLQRNRYKVIKRLWLLRRECKYPLGGKFSKAGLCRFGEKSRRYCKT
jgi:hypothetical protein